MRTERNRARTRTVGKAAAMAAMCLLTSTLAAAQSYPLTYQAENVKIQPAPGFFKFQTSISKAKLPIGDAIFQNIYTEIRVPGTTRALCSEDFAQVRVHESILNLELGHDMTCDLNTVVAANPSLELVVCIENRENCLKPVALASVPYALHSSTTEYAQKAYNSEMCAISNYAHRVTADPNLFMSRTIGKGYFDFHSPTTGLTGGTATALEIASGTGQNDAWFQWSPVATASVTSNTLRIAGRSHATGLPQPLSTLALHAGTTLATGNVTVDNNLVVTSGNATVNSGTLNVNMGRATLGGGATITGLTSPVLGVTGTSNLNGALNVTGTSTLTGSLNVNSASSTVASNLTVSNGAINVSAGSLSGPVTSTFGRQSNNDDIFYFNGTVQFRNPPQFLGGMPTTPISGGLNGAIVDGSITADDLGTDSVGADEIAANAVGASEIAASAVDTSELASRSVTAAKIATGTFPSFYQRASTATVTGSLRLIDTNVNCPTNGRVIAIGNADAEWTNYSTSNTTATVTLNVRNTTSSGGSPDQSDMHLHSADSNRLRPFATTVAFDCTANSNPQIVLWGLTSSGDTASFQSPKLVAFFVPD